MTTALDQQLTSQKPAMISPEAHLHRFYMANGPADTRIRSWSMLRERQQTRSGESTMSVAGALLRAWSGGQRMALSGLYGIVARDKVCRVLVVSCGCSGWKLWLAWRIGSRHAHDPGPATIVTVKTGSYC